MRKQAAIALLLWTAVVQPALACAPAPRAGERIDIVEESAVIVWDPATKTQHFIRRATFRGEAKDFGFLVPTPSAPTLTEVDDSLFATLEATTARQTIERTRKEIDWTPVIFLILPISSKSETAAGRAPVEVLSTQKVAGYEAAVLDATDATALRDWLAQHGYAVTDNLAEWLDVYVQKRWTITAFKIDKGADEHAQTSAVKMSFATERPFFPYREPSSPSSNSVRSLRVFFLSPERVAGQIGEGSHWAGLMLWSNRLDAALRSEIGRVAVSIPEGTWLTSFLDQTQTRANDDLYFVRSASQTAYAQPPLVNEKVETTNIPVDLLVLSIVAVTLAIRALLRRR